MALRTLDEVAEARLADARSAAARTLTPSTQEAPAVRSPLVQTLKTDATEAAWRTAGSQLVKLARDPLVGLLSRHLAPEDESLRARIAGFLETELGTALLAGLLSVGLASVPVGNDVTQKLGRELRIRAMTGTADLMADVLMGPLRQVVTLYLQDPAGAPSLGNGASHALEMPDSGIGVTPVVPQAIPVRRPTDGT